MKKFTVGTLICLSCLCAQAGSNSLHYSGDSYVAAGLTETISSEEGFAFETDVYNTRSSVRIDVSNLAIEADPSLWKHYSLWLTSSPGSDLSIGTYANVGIAPPEFPGLSFGANYRGIGFAYEGSHFNILDIAFDEKNVLSVLAVDFVQTDYNDQLGREGRTYGSLRYQSDIPLTVPEPESYALILVGLGLIGITRWRQYSTI